jgi:hypothetical protein
MPTFGDKLTDDDTEAIIEFFKDNWGSEEREYQKQVTDQDQGQSLGPPRKIPTVTSRGNRATYGGRRNHERLR